MYEWIVEHGKNYKKASYKIFFIAEKLIILVENFKLSFFKHPLHYNISNI